jgi:hypothetical protein
MPAKRRSERVRTNGGDRRRDSNGNERRIPVRGIGSAVFAAILLLIAGTLNIIFGIAAVGDSSFYANNTHYVFSSLHTWGWVTVIIGVVQLTAGFSLFAGGTYGRVIGIIAASLGALGALLAVGGAYPFWALGVFAMCLIVIHGLVVYGRPKPDEPRTYPEPVPDEAVSDPRSYSTQGS